MDELTGSESAGRRLAAVSTQAIPDARYLTWLSEPLPRENEKPFIGYHAALGLVSAARTLDASELPLARDAIARPKRTPLPPDRDRDTTPRYAEDEIARSMSGGG